MVQSGGRSGTVVGSSRNGIPYLKAKSKGRTPTVSDRELFNRKKFAAAQAWLKPLLNFVREGFRGYSQRSHGFIAAKSWLLKNAFVEEDRGFAHRSRPGKSQFRHPSPARRFIREPDGEP